MAWLYSRREATLDAALGRMAAGIPTLNAALATPAHLYHDTVTRAFGTLIHRRATAPAAPESWPEFEARHPELFDRSRPILHHHYQRETLATEPARTSFLPPDRAPF
jgi:hypothetical protein